MSGMRNTKWLKWLAPVLALSILGSGYSEAPDPRILQVAPLPTSEPLPAIERLGFEAGRCRGTCAAFKVVFEADGTFAYEGEANVERMGDHSGRVNRAALAMVMRYVEEIGFKSLAPRYTSALSDFQTTYIIVDYADPATNPPAAADGIDADGVKVVENQGGTAPATVWALQRLLVGLLDEAVWD